MMPWHLFSVIRQWNVTFIGLANAGNTLASFDVMLSSLWVISSVIYANDFKVFHANRPF